MIPAVWRAGRGHALLRLALLPAAAVFRVTARLRHAWHGFRHHPPLEQPAVIIGNLTVGGTGKTPLAIWWAGALAARGARPGIVVHAHARDEAALIAQAVPEATVACVRVRRDGARALGAAADVLVFDDGLQHPGLTGAVRVALIAAEQEALSPWAVPAGPWRAPRRALREADLIVVTRKTATAAAASALAQATAETFGVPAATAALVITGLRPLGGGPAMPPAAVAGRRVLAVAGIADPEPFRRQLTALGAEVELLAWPDHHAPSTADLRLVLEESRHFDYVVVTSKDAVKLQTGWPDVPAPLVAELAVHWEAGYAAVSAVLDRLVPERHVLTRNLRQAAAGIS